MFIFKRIREILASWVSPRQENALNIEKPLFKEERKKEIRVTIIRKYEIFSSKYEYFFVDQNGDFMFHYIDIGQLGDFRQAITEFYKSVSDTELFKKVTFSFKYKLD
uniref:Uncharacterized protein n=1 Tax=Siphoviridae sp. ctDOT22 TaxID=2827812 RepID=A0A8S5SX49_9CAUD|nr:MAG TPA: hypothetical protein [Siphoviridae sp. ctDOT22]